MYTERSDIATQTGFRNGSYTPAVQGVPSGAPSGAAYARVRSPDRGNGGRIDGEASSGVGNARAGTCSGEDACRQALTRRLATAEHWSGDDLDVLRDEIDRMASVIDGDPALRAKLVASLTRDLSRTAREDAQAIAARLSRMSQGAIIDQLAYSEDDQARGIAIELIGATNENLTHFRSRLDRMVAEETDTDNLVVLFDLAAMDDNAEAYSMTALKAADMFRSDGDPFMRESAMRFLLNAGDEAVRRSETLRFAMESGSERLVAEAIRHLQIAHESNNLDKEEFDRESYGRYLDAVTRADDLPEGLRVQAQTLIETFERGGRA